jgi:hypothetical protein
LVGRLIDRSTIEAKIKIKIIQRKSIETRPTPIARMTLAALLARLPRSPCLADE